MVGLEHIQNNQYKIKYVKVMLKMVIRLDGQSVDNTQKIR